MGRTNPKIYGTRKEREYANLLVTDGYVVERSGASLGDFDLIALRKPSIDCGAHSLWVQVKAGRRNYIRDCKRRWEPPSLPPYHYPRLACWIKEDRKWYDFDGEKWVEH